MDSDLYRLLFDSIDDGLCIIEMIFDEERRPIDYLFVDHNRTFEAQTGLVKPKGKTARQLVPNLEQHWFDLYGSVALTGRAIRFEQSSVPMNRWFNVYAFRYGEAQDGRVAIMFSDITGRKMAELRAEFLVKLSRDLAPLADEKAIVRCVTHAVGNHFKVDRCYFVECLESQNLIVASENWHRPGSTSLEGEYPLFDFGGIEWWRKYAGGNFAVEDTETHPLTQDRLGNYRRVGVRAYVVQPFRSEGGWTVVLGITESVPRVWSHDEISLLEDIVSRAWPLVQRARVSRQLSESQQDLQKSQEQLERHALSLEATVTERTEKLRETIADLEAFSYTISHDLRAPLRAMQSYARIILEEHATGLASDAKDYLLRIASASRRMDRLITDILSYSRISKEDLSLEIIEPDAFIADTLDLHVQFGQLGEWISFAQPMDKIRASPGAFTLCISNLVGNAVKFTRPGLTPKIEISTERKGDRVVLHVKDNGVGISPAQHSKIFGIFYQVNPQAEGTGIGLAIVNKAMERMGGSVRVSSVVGEGTTFSLEFVAGES